MGCNSTTSCTDCCLWPQPLARVSRIRGGGGLFINPGSAGSKRFNLLSRCGTLTLTATGGADGQTKYKVQVHNIETGETLLTQSGAVL